MENNNKRRPTPRNTSSQKTQATQKAPARATAKAGTKPANHAARANAPQRNASAQNQYSRANQLYRVKAEEQRRAQNHKKHMRIGLIVLAIVLVLVAVVGVSGFTLYNSAKTLKADASKVMTAVDTLKASVKSGEYDAANQTAQTIQSLSNEMKDEMESPLWSLASKAPVYGGDVSGAKAVVSVLSEVSDDALVPLTQALVSHPLSEMIREDGSIDVEMVSDLLQSVQSAAPVMQECSDKLNAVPKMKLEQLEKTLAPAKTKFSEINELFQKAAGLAPIASTLLGVDGNRNYLIVAQNSAEMRSTGGFPGALGMLSIADGKIEMGDFGTPYDLMSDTTTLVSEQENTLFNITQFDINTPRDSGVIPNFELVANIWATAYAEKTGNQVDGVVAVTPSVVQDMLKIAGEITLSDGTVMNGNNATKVLESELYWKYLSMDVYSSENQDVCDALFSEAASKTFKKTLGSLSGKTLMSMAQTMMDDFKNQTVLIWMTNSDEQALIDEFNCTGKVGDDETEPVTYIYIGRVRASKIGWYLDATPTVGEPTKNADGTTSYQITLNLGNAMGYEEMLAGGEYISGTWGKLDPVLFLMAPAGGSITDVVGDGITVEQNEYLGHQLITLNGIDMDPGETQVVTYTVTVSANVASELEVFETPTLTKYRNS